MTLSNAVAIVDNLSLTLGQDADRVQRLPPAFGVHFQVSGLFCACHVCPEQLPLHPQSRLVAVDRLFSLDQVLFYSCVDRCDLFFHLLAGGNDRGFNRGVAVQVDQDFPRAP